MLGCPYPEPHWEDGSTIWEQERFGIKKTKALAPKAAFASRIGSYLFQPYAPHLGGGGLYGSKTLKNNI